MLGARSEGEVGTGVGREGIHALGSWPQSHVPQLGGETALGCWSMGTSRQGLWTEGWRGGQDQGETQLRSVGLILKTRSHQLVAARPGRVGETGILERELWWVCGRMPSRAVDQRWGVNQESIGDEEERGMDVNNGEGEQISRTW